MLDKILTGLKDRWDTRDMLVVNLLHIVKSNSLDPKLTLKSFAYLMVCHLSSLIQTIEDGQVMDVLLLAHIKLLQNFLK